MTDALLTSRGDLGRLRYAEACLKQGMSYQAAARASDVCISDLKDFAPGYAPAHREAPPVSERTPIARCAAILPAASPEELGQIAALALRLLCESSGIHAVQTTCANAIKAMPIRLDATTPRGRLMGLVDEVAERHGISREQLLSRSHCRQYAHPRQEAYWVILKETGMSLPAIGRLFGGRDHTTILHGVRAHEARMGLS